MSVVGTLGRSAHRRGDRLRGHGAGARRRGRAVPGRPRPARAGRAPRSTSLYRHQAEAWEAARRGEHLIVTTGTASGKTLAFNLPVLDAIARDPKTRVLYLYPTKALAQDQARSLQALGIPEPARRRSTTATRETEKRWQIRKWANAILSNPDMLHVGVLPHHDRWGDVLANLRYVVVDEAHVYRGVFGSHVANVLRRLRRLARVYGAEPQFLLASATIANPGELAHVAARRRRRPSSQATRPRAPSGRSPLEPAGDRRRAQPAGERARRGTRAARRPRLARSSNALLREEPPRGRADPPVRARPAWSEYRRRLSPYRAGYTPAQRRDIERRLVEGELLGVSATDALELGIDVGLLDAVVSVGFPGTVASLRQQWGRAGRRATGSRCSSRARTRSTSTSCASRRRCSAGGSRRRSSTTPTRGSSTGTCSSAAFEGPLDDADRETLGDEALARAAVLPELKKTARGYVWAGRDYPAARVSLRSREPGPVPDRRVGRGIGARDARARACLLRGARRRRLPAPRRAVPREVARPGDGHGARRRRSRATGTRRRRRRRRRRSRPQSASSGGSGSTSPSGESR